MVVRGLTFCGCSSVEERDLAKVEVAGSIPVTRSVNHAKGESLSSSQSLR